MTKSHHFLRNLVHHVSRHLIRVNLEHRKTLRCLIILFRLVELFSCLRHMSLFLVRIDYFRGCQKFFERPVLFLKVIIKMSLRSKCTLTIWCRAVIWSFARVESHVRLKITLLVECLPAVFEGADEVADTLVLLQVHL